MSTGFIVLGHGSRVAETIEILRSVTDALKQRLQIDHVQHAALQFNDPDLPGAIAALAGNGVREIVILPFFLINGNHIREDIPEIIESESLKYPGVSFKLADHIGADVRITDILVDRIVSMNMDGANGDGMLPRKPADIEAESFRIIESLVDLSFATEEERPVIQRIIHASGDLSLINAIAISDGAIDAGINALKSSCAIVTDVRMVSVGISRKLTSKFSNDVECRIDDPAVESEAKSLGKTRSATAMRMLAGNIGGGIVSIGNAPTALLELIDMVNEGYEKPALVIGTPVGFVDAAESKRLLENSGLNYITVRGTRGGSAMAAAATNAILKLACR